MGDKLVCFNCRKVKNLDSNFDKSESINNICTKCNSEMKRLPHRFRPPKKEDLKKWKVVEYLFENGFEYEHFYDFENEKYLKIPENIYEAKEFIENYKLSEN